MLRIVTNFALATSLALPVAQAIIVAPGSPCSSNCGNVLQSTSTDDVVCSSDSYNSGAGQIFKGCVECEATSQYENKENSQTDTQWMLYNLRYATSYCLFGVPDNKNIISTPCITSKACGPFQDAIVFKNLSSQIDSYDYCAVWPVTDYADFNGCLDCLRVGDQKVLANFITVLQAGCEQQPDPGVNIGIDGDIFSTDKVNITAASASPTVNPDWFEHGPLTLEAKVGIAVGGFVLLLILLGCGIVWNGKRRRRAFLRTLEAKQGHNGWPSPITNNHSHYQHGEMRETPLSQRPLRGWDDSPMSASTEKTFPRYFSPYSSQYNSPVTGTDGPSMPWPDAALAANHTIGLAMSPDGGNEGHPDRNNASESYELHEVDSAGGRNTRGKQRMEAPVLAHPGFGRKENSPPRKYALTEEDAKRGGAF